MYFLRFKVTGNSFCDSLSNYKRHFRLENQVVNFISGFVFLKKKTGATGYYFGRATLN